MHPQATLEVPMAPEALVAPLTLGSFLPMEPPEVAELTHSLACAKVLPQTLQVYTCCSQVALQLGQLLTQELLRWKLPLLNY